MRSDGKRPADISLVPRKCSQLLVWDVACPDTYAPSYLALAGVEADSGAGVEAGSEAGVEAGSVAGVEAGSVAGVEAGSVAGVEAGSVAGVEAGSVAAEAEYNKHTKYQELDSMHHFMPLAIETTGACSPTAAAFFY